ncbi:hypothetical protein D3C81_1587340 [compost metagenome]
MGFAQQVVSARQQHRNGTGVAHRPGILFGGIFKVIGGKRMVLRRQFATSQRGKLFGMQFHRQSGGFCGGKHPCHLGR